MGVFGRIRQRIFGKKPERHPLGEFKSEAEQRQAERAVAQARQLGQRAAQAEQAGRNQAEQARKRRQDAINRGDRQREQLAREEEQKALEFAAKARREREAQARRERDAEREREQAVIKGEQERPKARDALLRTRKEMAEAGDWGFQGPAPKNPQVYKNIKSGEGDIPDQAMFLLGARYTAFASSNVTAIQYDPRKGDMYVEYVGGRWYRYFSFTKAEALKFYAAASKGIYVWDSIRVRGENPRSKSPPASTRKRFERDSPPPSDLPLESSAAYYGTSTSF